MPSRRSTDEVEIKRYYCVSYSIENLRTWQFFYPSNLEFVTGETALTYN